MNWGKVIALGLIAGGLAGCGKQVEGPAKTAASKSTQAVKHQAKQKVVWTSMDDARLASLMEEFSASRNQRYTKVTSDADTTWQGQDLSAYMKGKRQVTFDNQKRAVKWLGTRAAQSKATANVVAVYADDTDGILYLFEVAGDDQARVWVSQEAPGEGELSVKQTQAADLTAGFKQVAAGERAHLKKAPTQAATTSSTSEQTPANAADQSSANNHAQVFDASFQHTWYAYSDDDSELETVQIEGNSISFDGNGKAPVYLDRERNQEDRDYYQKGGDVPSMERSGWLSAHPQTNIEGRVYTVVSAWYSMAGFGTSYRVVNRDIDGQTQPVLESASGSEAWVDINYYLTPELAEDNIGVIYSDQVER